MNINPDYEKLNRKQIQFIRDGIASEEYFNITLQGETLSGKSWIANEIYKAIDHPMRRKLTANEIASKYEYYKFSDFSDRNEFLSDLYRLRFCPVLILDDIGDEFGSAQKTQYIKSFLSDRLDFISRTNTLSCPFPKRIITVFTTRLKQADIRVRYGIKVEKGLPSKTTILQIKGLPITYNVIKNK